MQNKNCGFPGFVILKFVGLRNCLFNSIHLCIQKKKKIPGRQSSKVICFLSKFIRLR